MNTEFDLHEQQIIDHRQEHLSRTITEQKPFCRLCYPTVTTTTRAFKQFWSWIRKEYRAFHFTQYTISALEPYFVAFADDPNLNNKSEQVVKLARGIIFSLSYNSKPLHAKRFLVHFLTYTFRSNYFTRSLTDIENTQ